jgi:hypothetical protein
LETTPTRLSLFRRGVGLGFVESVPSETRPTTHAHDFDFYVGIWKIHNRRLRKALAGSEEWYEFEATSTARPVLGGLGNFDEFEAPSEGISGLTLRLFDPERDEWLLYWASSRGGPMGAPQVGRFDGDRGEFYADDVYEGQPIRVVYVWSEITENTARWEQAFSVDGGQTWETNWIMESTKVS